MASFSCCCPSMAFSPSGFSGGTKYLSSRSPLVLWYRQRSPRRGASMAVQVGFIPGFISELGSSEGVVRDLVNRADTALYTVADVAVASSEAFSTVKEKSGWFSGIANCMENVLMILKDGLSAVHVPYSYGFAIILLTVIIKAATYPLTKKQVESAITMRSLQPILQAIQQQYAGDKEKVQLETARLYRLAGANPLAGLLPTLLTIPVWIGLYKALSNVANEGLLTEGFFWIPSLAGPTTIAARQSGRGISWLFPFVDGQPPLGWSNTFAYLVLPLLLIVSQYVSMQIMQSLQGNDRNMKRPPSFTKFMPLFMGYFSLSVPSGLSLYWLTNNVLTSMQQIWIHKFGGTKIPPHLLNNFIGRDDQSQTGSSSSVLSPIKHGSKEILTPDGKKPGEKFRQIKEQEASRRKLREEEKRAASLSVADEGLKHSEMTEKDNKSKNVFYQEKNGGYVRDTRGKEAQSCGHAFILDSDPVGKGNIGISPNARG